MYLLIDISERNIIHLTLFGERERIDCSAEAPNRDALKLIEKCLHTYGKDVSSIAGIAAVVGEGGFTGTRIGVIIANAFAFVRKIPVAAVTKKESKDLDLLERILNKRPAGEYIAAQYGGEVNIGDKP